jgi:hypothetical protein
MGKHRKNRGYKTENASQATMTAFKTWKTWALSRAHPSIRGCTAIQTLKKSKCARKYRKHRVKNIFQNKPARKKMTRQEREAWRLA